MCSYVEFTFDKHFTRMIGKHQFHPGPTDYPPSQDTLFRNEGDGTFTYISQLSGIANIATTSMGVFTNVTKDAGTGLAIVESSRGAG